MRNSQPIFDATLYRIDVQGRVEIDWLKSFDSSAAIYADPAQPVEDITVLNVVTDQSGIVGLVRRLHGLGMVILGLQVVSDGSQAPKNEEGC